MAHLCYFGTCLNRIIVDVFLFTFFFDTINGKMEKYVLLSWVLQLWEDNPTTTVVWCALSQIQYGHIWPWKVTSWNRNFLYRCDIAIHCICICISYYIHSNQLIYIYIYRIWQIHANSTNIILTITKNYPKSGLLYHWYMFEFHVDINYVFIYILYPYLFVYLYIIYIYIYMYI